MKGIVLSPREFNPEIETYVEWHLGIANEVAYELNQMLPHHWFITLNNVTECNEFAAYGEIPYDIAKEITDELSSPIVVEMIPINDTVCVISLRRY